MGDTVTDLPTDRPVTPELVPLWQELKVRYVEKVKDLKERQARLYETMVMVENLLVTPLGRCPLQEVTEAKISMWWAVHWQEVHLVAWKMRMLTATEYFMQVYKSY